jgi:hypothetical protein
VKSASLAQCECHCRAHVCQRSTFHTCILWTLKGRLHSLSGSCPSPSSPPPPPLLLPPSPPKDYTHICTYVHTYIYMYIIYAEHPADVEEKEEEFLLQKHLKELYHMYMCVRVCVCLCVCVSVCVRVYVCMYTACMYVCMHVCMHVYIYIYIYIYTYSPQRSNGCGWFIGHQIHQPCLASPARLATQHLASEHL